MRARAAWAVLFIGLWLAVAFIVEAVERPVSAKGETAFFISGVSCNLYFNTKFGSMPYRVSCENSIIIGPSPHIGVCSSFSNLMHCYNWNCQSAAVLLQTRSNHNSLCAAVIWECKIVWKIASINGKPRVDTFHSMFCWGVSAILPNRKEYPFDDFLRLFLSSPDMLDPFAKNECPLGHNESFAANFHLVSGRFSGFLGRGDRPSHVERLLMAEPQKSSACDYECAGRYEETEGVIRKVSRQFDNIPIKIRLLGSLSSLLFNFLFCLLGWRNIYNNRLLIGCSLIICGTLIFGLFNGFALHLL